MDEQTLELVRVRSKVPKPDGPFTVSVDLMKYCKKLLKFLEVVYANKHKLYCEPAIFNSYIDKYLKFMKLKHRVPQVVPSLEVEWVWFCHVLRPKLYHQFCDLNFKQIIDHSIDDWQKGVEDPTLLAHTAELFMQEYNEQFLFEEIPKLSSTEIKYLETADIYNDWSWYEKIQECPLFPSEEFLQKAHAGYVDFLKNIQISGFRCGPPISIDLFWHTHLSFPVLYKSDCDQMFGIVIYHTPLGSVAQWTDFPSNLTEDLKEEKRRKAIQSS